MKKYGEYLKMGLVALYVCAYTMMLPLGAKMVEVGVFAITPGDLLLFPLLYILSDVFSEVYGYRMSRVTAFIAVCCSLLFSVLAWVGTLLPYDRTSFNAPYAEAFNTLFAPSILATISGLSIFFVGDWINDIIMQTMRLSSYIKGFTVVNGKGWGVRYVCRSLVSSLAGRLFDVVAASIVIGHYIYKSDWSTVWTAAVWIILAECIYELVLSPINAVIVKQLSKGREVVWY